MTIDDQLARLIRNFNKAIDDDLAEEYHLALRRVPLPIVALAVSRAIQTRTFLPNVGELLQDVAAVSPVQPRAEVDQFEPCGECDHGWRQQTTFYKVPVGRTHATSFHPTTTVMERCSCWLAYQAQHAPADPRKVAHFRARAAANRRAS